MKPIQRAASFLLALMLLFTTVCPAYAAGLPAGQGTEAAGATAETENRTIAEPETGDRPEKVAETEAAAETETMAETEEATGPEMMSETGKIAEPETAAESEEAMAAGPATGAGTEKKAAGRKARSAPGSIDYNTDYTQGLEPLFTMEYGKKYYASHFVKGYPEDGAVNVNFSGSADSFNYIFANGADGGLYIADASYFDTSPVLADVPVVLEDGTTFLASVRLKKAAPTISFTDTSVTKSYGDAAFMNAFTTDSDGGVVSYTSSNGGVAIVGQAGEIDEGYVYIQGVGTTTITVSLGGSSGYDAGSASYTLKVNKAAPAASFINKSVTKAYGDAPFKNALSTNSTGAVTYRSSDTGVATVSADGTVTIKGVGTTTITADVAADGNYNAASASYTLAVSAAGQDAPNVSGISETVRGKNDGRISGLSTGMETSTDGSSYSAVTDVDAGFAPGTYYVRYAATGTKEASGPTTVVIGAGRYLTVTFKAEGSADVVKEVGYNGSLSDIPDVPEREGYDSSGWDRGSFKNITNDIVVNAVYTKKEYTITFKADGAVVATRTVGYGSTLVDLPGIPEKEGYDKVKPHWDRTNFGNISSDIEVNAVYTINKYTITFKADGKVVAEKSVTHGDALSDIPEVPAKEGTSSAAWDREDFKNIKGDATVNAVYTAKTYKVTFRADGKDIAVKTAGHGKALTDIPKVPVKAGYDRTEAAWDRADFNSITEDIVVNAVYTANVYTVTFIADGRTISEKTVEHGKALADVPEVPVKEGYDNAVWDRDDFSSIKSDVAVHAVYHANQYSVAFVADGKTVATKTVEWGKALADIPAVPAKAGYDDAYWDRADFSSIKSDLTVNAVYNINHYTVTFVADGRTVAEKDVEWGKGLADVPEVPVKEGYGNAVWDRTDFSSIKKDLTVTAVYTINRYTVTFKADGETVATRSVEHGKALENVPEVPVKEGYDKSSARWDISDFSSVTGDMTANAVYTANQYAVTFIADGKVVKRQTVNHGGSLTDIPEIPEKEGYDKAAPVWDTEDFENITKDLVVNAIYKVNEYSVTFVADGKTVAVKDVGWGKSLTDIPEVPEKEGYSNAVWSSADFSSIKNDMTVNAVYSADKFTVTFRADGIVVAEKTVGWGESLTDIPEVPAKQGYDKAVWNRTAFGSIKQDITVDAVYTINTYKVTFRADGKDVAVRSVGHGKALQDIPEVPVKEGYNKAVWDVTDFTCITSDTVANAVYTANRYIVTFIADGKAIAEKQVVYGSTLTDIPEVPAKEGCSDASWDREDFSSIRGDMTVNAIYKKDTYTVTFVADGKTAATRVVEWGKSLPDIPTVPAKEGHSKAAWDTTDFSSIKSNLTVNAVYAADKYNVTFVADGKTVATKEVEWGGSLGDVPEVPVKEGHTAAWDRTDFSSIRSDVTVNAVYTANEYRITFSADGKTVAVKKVKHGEELKDIPAVPAKAGCDVAVWDRSDFSSITADATVNAVYEANVYTVTFIADGKVAGKKTVGWGEDLTDIPEVPEKEGYSKAHWDVADLTSIKSNVVVNAVYEADTHTVTFKADGKTVAVKTVEWGKSLTDVPEIPTKEGHSKAVWDSMDFSSIKEDRVVNAVYSIDTHTVVFKADGVEVAEKTVEWGKSLDDVPEVPVKEGYDKAAWDKADFTSIKAEITVNAIYTANVYKVTFRADGKDVAVKSIEHGKELKDIPEVPFREGYDKALWDVADFSSITGDTVVNAVYSANRYVITFVADGKVVAEKQATYGSVFTDIPDVPVKEGYDSAVWDRNDFSFVRSDLTVNAVYTANKYKVTFVADGKTVAVKSVEWGKALTDIPAVPTKEGYSKAAWDTADFSSIKSDMTVNAVYEADIYDVVFVADGKTVATKEVEWGGSLSDVPEVPIKEGHTASWDRTDFNSIKSDITVNAAYEANEYKITFAADGKTVAVKKVKHGEELKDIPDVPKKAGSDTAVWDRSDFSSITADATVNAVYEADAYTVTFIADGRMVDKKTVSWGEDLTEIPAVPEKEGYDKASWDVVDFTSIKDNIVANAVYEANQYKVTFVADGKTVAVKTVEWGKSLTDVPEVPAKEGYSRASWDTSDFSSIKRDMTVNAAYVIDTHVVTFKADGIVVAEKAVDWGKNLEDVPSVPVKEGYGVAAWDRLSFDSIKSDVTVNAVYKVNTYTVTFVADGKTVSTKIVEYGKSLSDVPSVPEKEGYNKAVWDRTDFGRVTSDVTVNAVYSVNKYKVTFKADGVVVAEEVVGHGDTLTDIPEIPEKEGYDNAVWDRAVFSNITEDLVVNAIYSINSYIITFVADGETVATRMVKWGEDLTNIPAVPAKTGYDQTEPVWDKTDFGNIRDNLVVNAAYVVNKYTIDVSAPEGAGYTIEPVDGNEKEYGDSFSFKVNMHEEYEAGSDFRVLANGVVLVPDDSGIYTVDKVVGDVELKIEGVEDKTAPAAEVVIGENRWSAFLNTITFGLFSNETQRIVVNASDLGSGVASVQYYITESALALDEVRALDEWADYTKPIKVSPNGKYIVYAKVTDNSGNVTYVSSEGLMLSTVAPVVGGVEDGESYYGDLSLNVSGTDIEKLIVDGAEAEAVNGAYVIAADNQGHKIVAVDKFGNMVQYVVTVYKNYTVTFMADDKVLEEVAVGHGKPVANAPKIPTKEGYDQVSPHWDTEDFSSVTGDMVVKAVYTKNVYEINTDDGKDDGYTINPVGGGKVSQGEDFTFGVVPEDGFEKADGFAVIVNGKVLEANADGTYTVKNVKGKPDIRIEGIVATAAKAQGSLDSALKLDVRKDYIRVQWGKVAGADGYEVFAGRCYKPLGMKKPARTVAGGDKTTAVIRKLGGRKINAKYNYKARVKAYKMVNGKKVYLGSSMLLRAAGTKSKKYTNAKKVQVARTGYVLRKGKTASLEAKGVKADEKKAFVLGRRKTRLRYYSTDRDVATVTRKGKIKAVGAGKCIIYVIEQNGVRRKVKVTVK